MNVVEVEFDIDGEVIFWVDHLIEDFQQIAKMQIDFILDKDGHNKEAVKQLVDLFRQMNDEPYTLMTDEQIQGVLISQIHADYFTYMTIQK